METNRDNRVEGRRRIELRPLPTFIIGGAPRSGTTYLYHLVDHHPEIYMAKPRAPEPKFFLVDEEYSKGLDYYSDRFFSQSAQFAIRGEKSANYLESAITANRIAQDLPAVKLIFVLRDPVERAFSNFLWSTRNNHETLPFAEAVELEAIREASYTPNVRYARPYSYISRGMYAKLLDPYFKAFPREQIRIVLHDDIVARPGDVVAELMTFLGASVIYPPIDLNERVNTSRDRDQTRDQSMPEETREKLCQLYAAPNRELEQLIKRDLSHWSPGRSLHKKGV